jgi:hypothetical protein
MPVSRRFHSVSGLISYPSQTGTGESLSVRIGLRRNSRLADDSLVVTRRQRLAIGAIESSADRQAGRDKDISRPEQLRQRVAALRIHAVASISTRISERMTSARKQVLIGGSFLKYSARTAFIFL